MVALRFVVVLLLTVVASRGATAAPSAALGYAPKYPADFTHFDYVDPAAPKRGQLVLSGFGSFDSFNPFILKGATVDGISALVLEPLMVQSADEPYSLYAHLAEDIELAEDGLSVTFRLDPRARFSNGDPVLAEDALSRTRVDRLLRGYRDRPPAARTDAPGAPSITTTRLAQSVFPAVWRGSVSPAHCALASRSATAAVQP